GGPARRCGRGLPAFPGLPGQRSTGVDLNDASPGPRVTDARNGFSAVCPHGFSTPMPMPGIIPLSSAGMGRMVSDESTNSSGDCFLLCHTLPPEVFDQRSAQEVFDRLRSGLPFSMNGSLSDTHRMQFGGYE